MNNKSNEIWKNESNFNNWELRKHRFTDEMRPVFFKYLGITPGSFVLDGGCGTGVFTRYIAGGLTSGKALGFDISSSMVDFGNDMIKRENLSGVCQLAVADGFELPYRENTFDAVTNYTYLGVLSDPVAGLKDMIRVCKTGGTVSSVFASNGFSGIRWKGDYPFDFNDRLNELYEKQEEIYWKKILNGPAMYFLSEEWNEERYPKMFDMCGLKDIHIYPVAIGFSYSDGRWPVEYRKLLADTGISEEIRCITDRSRIGEFENYGFTRENFLELLELLRAKQKYLSENIETDRSYEWNARLNVIVTGIK